MKTKHCQICERDIKANTGVIAHHGYKRPGDGWQSASCWGARHLPYEESCDQIQPCIDYIHAYVEKQSKRLKDIVKTPPETMTRISMVYGRENKVCPKPEGFDPIANEERGSFTGGYEYEFHVMYREIKGSIFCGRKDIKRLTERLANWKLV